MGAWGVGPFDNDEAGDWSYGFDDLDSPAGLARIRAALAAASGPWVDAGQATIAVAAADVVARLHEGGAWEGVYGAAIGEWIERTSPSAAEADRDAAVAAVDRVGGSGSELAELWDESGTEWRAAMAVLRARLVS